MTVYVDDLYRYPAGQFGRMKMSHMVADDEAELHAMADRIGVARRWYQRDHYDVCLSKRAEAVKDGAREITWRQLGVMTMFRRSTGRLPDPDDVDVIQPAKPPRPAEVETLLTRLAELYTRRDAQVWLLSPQPLLDGQVPAALIRDGNGSLVEGLIGQITEGVYL